jgi:hypothetical protein
MELAKSNPDLCGDGAIGHLCIERGSLQPTMLRDRCGGPFVVCCVTPQPPPVVSDLVATVFARLDRLDHLLELGIDLKASVEEVSPNHLVGRG